MKVTINDHIFSKFHLKAAIILNCLLGHQFEAQTPTSDTRKS